MYWFSFVPIFSYVLICVELLHDEQYEIIETSFLDKLLGLVTDRTPNVRLWVGQSLLLLQSELAVIWFRLVPRLFCDYPSEFFQFDFLVARNLCDMNHYMITLIKLLPENIKNDQVEKSLLQLQSDVDIDVRHFSTHVNSPCAPAVGTWRHHEVTWRH